MKTIVKTTASPKAKHKESKVPPKTKKLTKTGKAYGFMKDEIIFAPGCFE